MKGFKPNLVLNGYSLTIEGSNRFLLTFVRKGTESKHNGMQELVKQIEENSIPAHSPINSVGLQHHLTQRESVYLGRNHQLFSLR
jgi:hypothetical protein